MKVYLISFLIFFICFTPLFSDAPDFDIVNIQRKVIITNARTVTDYVILAYIADKNSSDFRKRDIIVLDQNDVLYCDYYEEKVFLLALKKSVVDNVGLDNINFAKMIKEGKIVPVEICQPMDIYVPDYAVNLYSETITYRISSIADNRIFLEIVKVEQSYTDGRSVVKEFSRNKDLIYYDYVAAAASLSASSSLIDDDFPQRYQAVQVFDSDPETGWAEDSPGPGYGQYIKIRFKDSIKVDKIMVMPGWFQSAYFRKNNRIKNMTIVLNGKEYDVRFEDKMEPQYLELDTPIDLLSAEFIIKDVYRTEKWDDTPIAEIGFLYNGKSYKVDTSGVIKPYSAFDDYYGVFIGSDDDYSEGK